MARLDDIFEVKSGIASHNVNLSSQRTSTSIPYIRPAKTQQRTVAGWVDRAEIPKEHCHQRHSIFVSTNGEGSHTYAYVSDFEFAANSDVSVLIPKRDMTLAEKIFYAKAITLNREKFSCGRKPKGERLKRISLPDSAPAWARSALLDTLEIISAPLFHEVTPNLDIVNWMSFKLEDLFDIRKGFRLTKAGMLPGDLPYIGAFDANNGVTAYIGQCAVHEGNTISVSYNGSVGEAFYQPLHTGQLTMLMFSTQKASS